jgi:hypothetical protein
VADRYPAAVRVIPTFAMSAPWSAPLTAEEQEGLAMTGLLSGAADNDRAISTLLREFAGDYARNLNRGRG